MLFSDEAEARSHGDSAMPNCAQFEHPETSGLREMPGHDARSGMVQGTGAPAGRL